MAEEDQRQTNDIWFRNTFSPATFSIDNVTSNLRKTVTKSVGISPDNEEEWTKAMISKFKEADSKGVQGAMPPPAAFARDKNFWKSFMISCSLGAILGLATLVFMNVTDKIPKIWANNGYATKNDDYFTCPCDNNSIQTILSSTECVCNKYSNCNFYGGQLYWAIITTSAGLLIGLIRYSVNYPDDLPGLFQEIHSYHVNYKWAPFTILLSAISLAGGASLGPEQALGNLGGGAATFLTENVFKFEDSDYSKLTVLAGMTASLGALFPTPVLGVLMFHELGNPPKTYMESTLVLSSGAIVSFLVYYSLVDDTYIQSISSNGALLALDWEFNEWNCLTAFVIGIVSAALGIVMILFIGITRQILNRIRIRLQANPFLATVLPSCLAGFAIGMVNWALPLTIGNGNMVLSSIISYGYQGKLSTSLLISSGFGKAFNLGLSMNGGFVGGFIFPILTMGVIAGVTTNQMYSYVPLGLSVACFMAALPASICPMPFTLSCLAVFVFYIGLYQTAPVFISAITSYTIVVGSGLFSEMQKRGRPELQENQSKEFSKDDLQQHEERKQEDEVARKRYLEALKSPFEDDL